MRIIVFTEVTVRVVTMRLRSVLSCFQLPVGFNSLIMQTCDTVMSRSHRIKGGTIDEAFHFYIHSEGEEQLEDVNQ